MVSIFQRISNRTICMRKIEKCHSCHLHTKRLMPPSNFLYAEKNFFLGLKKTSGKQAFRKKGQLPGGNFSFWASKFLEFYSVFAICRMRSTRRLLHFHQVLQCFRITRQKNFSPRHRLRLKKTSEKPVFLRKKQLPGETFSAWASGRNLIWLDRGLALQGRKEGLEDLAWDPSRLLCVPSTIHREASVRFEP